MVALDTLMAAKELEAAGMPVRQAEAVARTMAGRENGEWRTTMESHMSKLEERMSKVEKEMAALKVMQAVTIALLVPMFLAMFWPN